VEILKHIGLPVEDTALAADELASQVYEITGTFPKAKGHDIATQMRRCALSVPPHLAEARRRTERMEAKWFLNIAISAMVELQYLLDFSLKQGYIKEEQYTTLKELGDRVESQLRDSPGPTVTGR
jgi:four helix bundle protein